MFKFALPSPFIVRVVGPASTPPHHAPIYEPDSGFPSGGGGGGGVDNFDFGDAPVVRVLN